MDMEHVSSEAETQFYFGQLLGGLPALKELADVVSPAKGAVGLNSGEINSTTVGPLWTWLEVIQGGRSSPVSFSRIECYL